MSGGGQNTVSTTVPGFLQPYYNQSLSMGADLLNSAGPQYYPGQTVAPFNPLQEQGLSQIQQNANGPNASSGARDANMFETSGALLNPSMNPYLQGTFQQGAQQVQNSLESEFGSAGRNVLSSLPVQSDEMNNLATQLYGGAYNTGLQAMTQASAMAPSIDAGTYLPSQQLIGAGAGVQGQTQNLINSQQNQWNYNQTLPYNQLSWYSGLLGANAAPFSQQNSSTAGNPLSTGLGAASLASSLYGSGAFSGAGSAATSAAAMTATDAAGYSAFATDAALAAEAAATAA